MELFDQGDAESPPIPSIADGTWRIDFSRGMRQCKYNAMAKREFVVHFMNALKQGSYTERGAVPERLQNAKQIANCLETSVKYLRGIWKGARRDPKLAAQGSRRDTVRLSLIDIFDYYIKPIHSACVQSTKGMRGSTAAWPHAPH